MFSKSALLLIAVFLFAGCVQFTPEYIKGTDFEKARLLYRNGYLNEARRAALKVPREDTFYRPAQRLIEEINAISMEIAREHMELGEDYERAGIPVMAMKEYKRSLRYNPDNILVQRKLALLIEAAGPAASVRDEAPGRAEKADEAGRDNKPRKKKPARSEPEEVANEHYIRGKVYLESRAYHLAIKEFTMVLDILPGFRDSESLLEEAVLGRDRMVDFHFKRGINFFQKEEISLAIREWDIVLALDPDNKDAEEYRKRAEVILERLKKIKERQADKASMLKSEHLYY